MRAPRSKEVNRARGAGAGMIPPGKSDDRDAMAEKTVRMALAHGPTGEGTTAPSIRDGQNIDGCEHGTKPSGGLLCRGHPLGTTGLAQYLEIAQQRRGRVDKRQVETIRFALQHDGGLGGPSVVTHYGKAA
jgi:acetyl-CoA acetyltransferase